MDKRETTPNVTGEIVGELINLAGRQRMLSQRIVLHALLGLRGDASAIAVARACLATFTASHAKLVDGDAHCPGVFSHALREVYFGARKADERIRAFVTLAGAACDCLERSASTDAHEAAVAKLSAEATPLLDLLQAITQAYQDEMRGVEAATARRHAGIVDELAAISMRANIVALNARVAAARAGQFGLEFAVITAELTHVIREMDGLVQSVVGKREAGASGTAHAGSNTGAHAYAKNTAAAPNAATHPGRGGNGIQRMPARVAG
ncbi:type IV pili methyl-accepting chemotaxis transducer N-terminal domain-containing protein [Paraburkholderia acidisoli]|uniref:Chemotaxis protein n=1 Tax=Paraburkholderia acidisoli TaxID=2571748 RepID=A0A7Z2GQB5_9BURK|nr:type IV pili methyl-accepting chemotaxis transducer N-terminal domain-containing protein [Paraburkholderia acidisoli]QGZ65958.1 chemotaxis protein [Paraburkholderia acidisoli]